MMDRERALELQRRGIEVWIREIASVSPGAELLELDGVLATVAPACPHRSLPSSAVHTGADSLEASLPRLTETYDRAGVAATAMWSLEEDPVAEAVLERFGYTLDGEPAAMHAGLDSLTLPELGDLDWDAAASAEEVGRVNDLAYGFPEGEGIAGAIGSPPPELQARSYRARVGDEVACVLQSVDVDSTDCLITWVATLPEHRGRLLASRLMAAALGEAGERGLSSTSLQASMLGRGVYERLGYELIGALRLHERQVGSAA